jgi:hypothetical protein
VNQGHAYATEALGYREKIANLALSFIKDDSVVATGIRRYASSISLTCVLDFDPFVLQSRAADAS